MHLAEFSSSVKPYNSIFCLCHGFSCLLLFTLGQLSCRTPGILFLYNIFSRLLVQCYSKLVQPPASTNQLHLIKLWNLLYIFLNPISYHEFPLSTTQYIHKRTTQINYKCPVVSLQYFISMYMFVYAESSFVYRLQALGNLCDLWAWIELLLLKQGFFFVCFLFFLFLFFPPQIE